MKYLYPRFGQMLQYSIHMLIVIFSVVLASTIGVNNVPTVQAESDLTTATSSVATTIHRDMIIDLGNSITTNARLNLPVVGDGPFPGVLIVPGSGPNDMNGTAGYIRIDNQTGKLVYPPSRPYLEIAQYLSERGFAVLQYDKRAVGSNMTILNANVWGNTTFNDLKNDAQKALDVLLQQPEVDANHITLIGHSEGTSIIPRIAIDNPGTVDKIVLMGAMAQNLRDIEIFQAVTLPLNYAHQVLDHDHNGLLSVKEASENPVFTSIVGKNTTLLLAQNFTSANGTTFEKLNSKYNPNNDTFISIEDELKPALIGNAKLSPTVIPGEKCPPREPCPIWLKSHYSLIPVIDIISKVPSDVSILILQGENDSQTPIDQAFRLQQKLTEAKHPDRTLITYPNLGHDFTRTSQWLNTFGPMEQKVLGDLFSWLTDPVRDFVGFTILQHE